MRVLHVHQIAHIPQLLTRHLRKKGLDCDFTEDVNSVAIKEYDLVHGHYALNRSTLKAFRLARKHKIPFVIHCHGSDVRRVTGGGLCELPFHYHFLSQYVRKNSARILLSTPDLIPFETRGEYVPNPVDTEKFSPNPKVEKTPRHLICGKQVKGSRLLDFIKPEIEYDCVNTGYPFSFPGNVRVLPYVEYSDFQDFLNRYTDMIGTVGDLISMTRLEAMACGLRTFTDFDKRYVKFYGGQNPDEVEKPREFIREFHSPEAAAERLLTVYDGIKLP